MNLIKNNQRLKEYEAGRILQADGKTDNVEYLKDKIVLIESNVINEKKEHPIKRLRKKLAEKKEVRKKKKEFKKQQIEMVKKMLEGFKQ